ncbi:Retrotransposon gag domain [Sesbania bispinosa]|nr:Retrotransposon gag domain [Sesbania bispinosa]
MAWQRLTTTTRAQRIGTARRRHAKRSLEAREIEEANIWRLHWGGAMASRSQRMTPRRLSFSLEDFPKIEGERHDLNLNHMGDAHQAEDESMPLSTPKTVETQSTKELNLLGSLETPVTTSGGAGNAAHTTIPTSVLNNIILNQQSLANLVADLKAQTRAEETAARGGAARRVEVNQPKQDYALVTQAELRWMLRQERGNPDALFDLEPPLTEEVLAAPYPADYQPPSFRKFDGTGSAREHLIDNKGLRMKEFSKSLSGGAFTWYVKPRPRSIQTWEDLATEFCEKFLEEEGAIHIMDLGRVKQKSGEGLIAFIKRYRDCTLQCKETLPEADLVYRCIKNIEYKSKIYLSLGGIATFAELMKWEADVSEAMRKQGKRNKETEGVFNMGCE